MNAFLGKVVGDFGASLSSALVYIRQKLGLYKAMSDEGPVTPAELAQRTNTNERDDPGHGIGGWVQAVSPRN